MKKEILFVQTDGTFLYTQRKRNSSGNYILAILKFK